MKSLNHHQSICKCYSPEHTVQWTYDKEENEVYFYVSLTWSQSLFKRIKNAIKYVFGYKSIYGDFDCFLFENAEKNKLVDFLKENIKS